MEHGNSHRREAYSGGNWWIIWAFVLIVIGAFHVVPNYMRHRSNRHYCQYRTNCIDIGKALQLYADDNDDIYPRSLTSLTPGYLKDIPVCASIGINGAYIHSYRVSRDLKAYTFYCEGLNHVNCGIGENYPQYSSGNGLVTK